MLSWCRLSISFFLFCMIKIYWQDQNCVYFCKVDMYVHWCLDRGWVCTNSPGWGQRETKRSSFTPVVAWETVKTQIWFCISTVPVFKPFNSSIVKLYWTCLWARAETDWYINKVFYFCKTNFRVTHSNLNGIGSGVDRSHRLITAIDI